MRHDELEQVIGGHIRNLRINRGLTQVEAADRANVSLGALKHLEGGAGATVHTLVKVLRALNHEDWLDTLDPGTGAFDPLALLDAREQEGRAARRRAPRRRAVDR
jgi:transcriptional regulator with XRE-family HTH domain